MLKKLKLLHERFLTEKHGRKVTTENIWGSKLAEIF